MPMPINHIVLSTSLSFVNVFVLFAPYAAMTLSILRRFVGLCMVGAIAAMITFSVRNNIGAAMVAGSVGAIATLCLITGTAIHTGIAGGGSGDGLAADLEARVEELTALGIDQHAARQVVRKAIRLGESRRV